MVVSKVAPSVVVSGEHGWTLFELIWQVVVLEYD